MRPSPAPRPPSHPGPPRDRRLSRGIGAAVALRLLASPVPAAGAAQPAASRTVPALTDWTPAEGACPCRRAGHLGRPAPRPDVRRVRRARRGRGPRPPGWRDLTQAPAAEDAYTLREHRGPHRGRRRHGRAHRGRLRHPEGRRERQAPGDPQRQSHPQRAAATGQRRHRGDLRREEQTPAMAGGARRHGPRPGQRDHAEAYATEDGRIVQYPADRRRPPSGR